MVLNVSGRTDIVAFYMDWFMRRLEEGYVLVRNPFYENLVHRIDFCDVDVIVFCTKNPLPLIKRVEEIKIPFIVHVTLTPYEKDIEPNVPSKTSTIEAIRKLSHIIGKKRIFIRYDPIFLNDKYDLEYHLRAFKDIVERLDGYTTTIIVSFIDMYKNTINNMKDLNLATIKKSDKEAIGLSFSREASLHGMTVQTCAEEETLFEYGFIQNDCVTSELIENLSGVVIKDKWTARKSRTKHCNCIKMYDIGYYNTCSHLCKYCYANYDEKSVMFNKGLHDDESPLLIGNIKENDTIKKINNNNRKSK